MIKIDKEYAKQVIAESIECSLRDVLGLCYGDNGAQKEARIDFASEQIVDQLLNNSECEEDEEQI